MKNLNEHAWVRQWKEIPAGRRALMSAALWGLLLIVICQLLWLPGQARMQQAEQALAREHEPGGHIAANCTGAASVARRRRVADTGWAE